jgi:hypothetical protein
MAIKIEAGRKYQTRNGRIVTIHAIVDGGMNDKQEKLPDYGVGALQGEGRHTWSLTGEYERVGVPHTFDLVLDAGKMQE